MIIDKVYHSVDVQVAGEPLRIITGGLPAIKGETQLERRIYCMQHLDYIRKLLMFEPRGHHGMYGCIITPPASVHADFGVLFMHNEGWSTMCGHGIIAVITMGIETGKFNMEKESRKFRIDTPAGEVIAYAKAENSIVESVSFENVPSFLLEKEIQLEIDGQKFTADVAFGGAFYAIVQSESLDLNVKTEDLPAIRKIALKIKAQVEEKVNVVHPLENGLHGIYGVIFLEKTADSAADLRNVTIFADGQVDRSPCGTGTCAVLATLFEKGKLKEGESFVYEGITGGQFTGKIDSLSTVGSRPAIIPKVTGNAFLTGIHQFFLDLRDPFPQGFLLE